MTISMYSASVPPITHALGNLKTILQKGADHAGARKIDPAVFINGRLFPDMFPLSRQVQIAADQGRGGLCRLAGIEPEKIEDTEQTFPELIQRIDRSLKIISGLRAEQIDGSEGRTISFSAGGHPFSFDGHTYLLKWIFPNLYFHATTAYNILRHGGVDVGKLDFLGKV
jgi:uncharacterized protein